jgi:hypothetical protein
VTVTLAEGGDDGEAGERDSIHADVENVVAGAGNDRIVGTAGANDLDGGPGDDSIDAAGGVDAVQGGSGNDSIVALDGVQDRVDCGPGVDSAVIDAFDSADGCEFVSASRGLMSDVDNDGIAAGPGLDCDDANPLRRPGLPDAPENGLDEDCVAGDARFPQVLATVSANFAATRTRVRPVLLVARDVPDTATIAISCTGRGCFRGTRSRSFTNGSRRVDMLRDVRKLRLGRNAVLEIRVLRPQTIGRVWQYRISRKRQAKSTVACLRPGAAKTAPCPRT